MRLRPDERVRRWLRRAPSPYRPAELLLIAALAVLTARLAWTAATPVSPLGDWRRPAAALPGTPLDILTGSDPWFRLSADTGSAPVTSLRLTLYGTRIDEAMGGGSAILAGPDGIQRSVAVGEEVVPGVRLQGVAFDHVTLAHDGRAEDLYLDQSGRGAVGVGAVGAGVAGGGASGLGAGGAPGPVPTNGALGALRAQIDWAPRLVGGRVVGLVVHPRAGSDLAARAGLRDGDVLTSIGGRAMTGPGDLEEFAAGAGGQIAVTVERDGRSVPLLIVLPAPGPGPGLGTGR